MKKSAAATTAMARYDESERPGFWFGKTESASVQVMSTKTTSQLQWIPIRIPAIRPTAKPSLIDRWRREDEVTTGGSTLDVANVERVHEVEPSPFVPAQTTTMSSGAGVWNALAGRAAASFGLRCGGVAGSHLRLTGGCLAENRRHDVGVDLFRRAADDGARIPAVAFHEAVRIGK